VHFAQQSLGSDCPADFAELRNKVFVRQACRGEQGCQIPDQQCDFMVVFKVDGFSPDSSAVQADSRLAYPEKFRGICLFQTVRGHEFFGNHGAHHWKHALGCDFAWN